jgi:pimeloyl-ACP methyl ester carboxylesterase
VPLRVAQVHVWGREDTLLPSRYGTAMVEAASQAGDAARLVLVDGAGHLEVARPLPPAWPVVRESIRALLTRP